MITLTEEQAQQIEETLVLICKAHPEVNGGFLVNMALDNIRAARAQPVLWQSKIVADCVSTVEMFNDEWRPLYAAPVRTKDLTDDEIAQAVGSPLDEVYLADFRAVIAKFKEKNK